MSPEQFLYRSFRILDEGDYHGWLALCTNDISYMVATAESLRCDYAVKLINDDYDRLQGRIKSMEKFWHAEKPPTRTHHMISNVECETVNAGEMRIHSCFLVTATRRERQVTLTGRYRDILRSVAGEWRLAARLAVLDKSRLDGGNITFIV